MGQMTFWVQVVSNDDDRLTLYDDASYEQAIMVAEEAGTEWEVPVHDLVES